MMLKFEEFEYSLELITVEFSSINLVPSIFVIVTDTVITITQTMEPLSKFKESIGYNLTHIILNFAYESNN